MTTTTGSRTPDRWLTAAAGLATAVNAGVFFDFSFVVMPAVRELPVAEGVTAMQALNRTAVTPPLMMLMYLTATLCVVLIVRAAMTRDGTSAPWIIASAVAFLLAAVMITGAGNVPASAAMDALDPSSTGASARWDELITRWVWWNHARILTSAVAAAGFAIALRTAGRPGFQA